MIKRQCMKHPKSSKMKKKIKDAVSLVKYFANNKGRMSLTDKIIESMLLLADTVESQMEEVE